MTTANCIKDVAEIASRHRSETYSELTYLSVSRQSFQAIWFECLQSMATINGKVPDFPMPDSFLLYGVKIVPEQVSLTIIQQINGDFE